MSKIKCAIIGPGNVGMNLLCKIEKSDWITCSLFVGRNADSRNLYTAKQKGYRVLYDSVESLIENHEEFDIVFDATSADSHIRISEEMLRKGKYVIDLTPSRIGKLCIPFLNGKECLLEKEVNMVTCGGQSMVPIAAAIKEVCDKVLYFETVSTISSDSAGKGTRDNIDDYIGTTQDALRQFTEISNVKSMIVLNPAIPQIIMHNTLYAVVDFPNLAAITEAVKRTEIELIKYVPGFKITVYPSILRENIVVVSAQVEGTGDYLPSYAGNLDIITCAAIEMAEQYVKAEIF